jgi:hypothetical protein
MTLRPKDFSNSLLVRGANATSWLDVVEQSNPSWLANVFGARCPTTVFEQDLNRKRFDNWH